jgi:hypothetical protein
LGTKNLVAAERRQEKRLDFVDDVNSASRNEEMTGYADEIDPSFCVL